MVRKWDKNEKLLLCIYFFVLYTCLKVTLLSLIAARDKISKHRLTGFQHVFNTEEIDKKRKG